MNVPAGLLRHHVEYNIWATRRLLDLLAELSPDHLARDFQTADKSIPGTLAHIYRSERSWFGRIEHGTPPFPHVEPGDDTLPALFSAWPRVHENWRAWASTLTDEGSVRLLDYTDLKGNPWTQPIWPIVLHVVNHSTHHRGQVSGFLRSLGHTPPPLDFIAFVRLQ